MKRAIPGMLLVLVSVALVVGIGGWCGWFKVNPQGERVGSAAMTNAQVRELRRALRQQEEVVTECKKVLDNIVRAKNVIYQAAGEAAEKIEDRSEDRQEELASQAERELIEIERGINGLRYLVGDELIRHAAGIVLPDNPVTAWYPKWLAAQQMAPANETEQGKVKDRLAPMERRLNDDVKGLIRRLEAVKVDASARLSGLEAQQGRAVIRNAKLRHDAERELLDWMNAKLRRMEGSSASIHPGRPFSTASMTVEFHALSWITTVIDRRYNTPNDGHRPPLQYTSPTRH